jgi:hypothetical protein
MKTLILLTSLILSTANFAGPGGGHSHGHGHSHGARSISKEKTGEIGRYHVERLVKAKKIDASWKSAIFDNSEKKNFKGRTEWVVTFNNEKGFKGKKLYIFLKVSGDFVAANFTGK